MTFPIAVSIAGSFNIAHPPLASSAMYASHSSLKARTTFAFVAARASSGSFNSVASARSAVGRSAASLAASSCIRPIPFASAGESSAPRNSASVASARDVALSTNSLAQNFGTGIPSATSFSPNVPCVHKDTAHPPAGHAPRIAHTVESGERRSRHRNVVCVFQNSAYLVADVDGAWSSLMSFPAVNIGFLRSDAKTTPRIVASFSR
eukprot:31418-Pelagococcus_subviridis.AAC.10